MNRTLATLAAVACSAPGLALAEASLKVGDPAPPLKVGAWVQGDAVKEFSRDNVYVVEFWATWCGPCIATIPHLDELHETLKDKGVVFIGQNCMEEGAADKVPPFVKKMGEKMSYRVATDDTSSDEKGFMAVNWMQAAEQNGIPCAFVVGKDGRIAWIGHPAGLKADLLEEVVAGTFDTEKAAAAQKKQAEAMEALMKVGQELNDAMGAGDWDKAGSIVDQLEKDRPEMADQLTGVRLGIGMRSGNSDLVVKSAGKFLEGPMGAEPQALNQIAWGIATELRNPSKEALALAEKAASRGVEKTESKNGALLDTLARVQFMQGRKDDAVKTQERAIEAADDETRADMKTTLESYKAGKLPAADGGDAPAESSDAK